MAAQNIYMLSTSSFSHSVSRAISTQIQFVISFNNYALPSSSFILK